MSRSFWPGVVDPTGRWVSFTSLTMLKYSAWVSSRSIEPRRSNSSRRRRRTAGSRAARCPGRIGLLAEVRVVDVAVGVGELARQAELDRIRDRSADPAAGEKAEAVVDARGDLAFELVARRLGADDDRAADRVAAVEAALRALEDLDLLDVEQLLVELGRIDLLHPSTTTATDGSLLRAWVMPRMTMNGVARVLRLDQESRWGKIDESRPLEDTRVLDRIGGGTAVIAAGVSCSSSARLRP
jgi:hypothetical protein